MNRRANEFGILFVTELSQLSIPTCDGTLVIFRAVCPTIKKITGHCASTQPSSFEKKFSCRASAEWDSIVVLGANGGIFFALVKICRSIVLGFGIG